MEINGDAKNVLLAELDQIEQELDKADRMKNKWQARVTALQASINIRRRLLGQVKKAG